MDIGLEAGFAAPVLQSQQAFRAIMDALANPGAVQALVTPGPAAHGVPPELVSVMLTLSDHDSAIWLDQTLCADQGLLGFLAFHTGAPVVADPQRAVFAMATGAGLLPAFDQFNLGTQEYPDRSTTIVLAVPSLDGGPALTLRGPGIKDHIDIAPASLPADFMSQWTANRALFPRGIDLLLVADGQVLGLPRSTRITEGH